MTRSSPLLPVLFAGLLLSCTGSITSAGDGSGSGPGGGGGPGGGAPSPPNPGASFLRRLTRFEYDNTVADLLGDTSRPARAFPVEDQTVGFDSGEVFGLSPLLAEQYLAAAETLAGRAVQKLSTLAPCAAGTLADSAAEESCARSFIQGFGRRAFRRTVTAEETTALLGVFQVGRQQKDVSNGIRLVVEAMLMSPGFLYRPELGAPGAASGSVVPLTSWEMASRLSYLLWGSMPDDALLAKAEADQLRTAEQIRTEAERLAADPRAHAAVAHFHEQWLKLSKLDALEKDTAIYPAFSPALVPLWREETARYVDDVFWNGPGDLSSLFSARSTWVDATLAGFYGLPAPTGSGFQKVDTTGTVRAGLLTQGSILAMLSKPNQTNPVQRGKFVREQLFCAVMPPPPANVSIKVPDLDPNLTTRERFSQHSTDPACSVCHRLMDPIGLGFEKFDGIGQARTMENGKPVDDSGQALDTDVSAPFQGVLQLEESLSRSQQVRDCVVQQWFRFAFGRVPGPEDTGSTALLESRFAGRGWTMRDVFLSLVETDAFRYRVSEGGGP